MGDSPRLVCRNDRSIARLYTEQENEREHHRDLQRALCHLPQQVAGKIVLFNPPWVTYKTSVKYRYLAASEAAKLGAVAVLVRSMAPFSIGTPHAGQQIYKVKNKIPAAAITLEDADLMERMQARGKVIIFSSSVVCCCFTRWIMTF